MENNIDHKEPAFWHMLMDPAATLASLEERPRALFPIIVDVACFVTAVRETMIALVVTMSRNLNGFNIKNPVGTNLAFFVDSVSPTVTKVLLSFDVITIAAIVLTVVGLRRIAKQLSPFAAASVVVIPWCLYVVAGMWLPWLG